MKKIIKVYGLAILFFCVLMCGCDSQSKISTNNNGGYRIIESIDNRLDKDSVAFSIRVYDIETMAPLNDANVYLYEDIAITKLFKESKISFTSSLPFFTVKAFGYKTIETRSINLNKHNSFILSIYLEPNRNPITE